MNDHGVSLNTHCTCQQQQCPIWGNCVLCIQNHLCSRRHIPECVQDMLRPAIQALAGQVELKTQDTRPAEAFWKTVDKEGIVKESVARHRAHGEGQ